MKVRLTLTEEETKLITTALDALALEKTNNVCPDCLEHNPELYHESAVTVVKAGQLKVKLNRAAKV